MARVVAAVTLALACAVCVLATAPVGKHFDHIFIIQFENHANWEIDLNSNFQKLMALGTHLTEYHAVAHPSQPNYIAEVAGSTLTCKNDGYITFDASTKNLVDLLEAKNLTWKGYMENYPGNCYDGDGSGANRYMRKHNPFISFENIRKNPQRCANIVNADQLQTDVQNNALPHFAYYTPGMDHDGHDTNVTYASDWVIQFLPPLLANTQFFTNTLVVLTWDEDDYTELNHIATILIGPNVKANNKDKNKYNHYSLLRTVEDNWDLGTLGRNDDTAVPFDTSIYLH